MPNNGQVPVVSAVQKVKQADGSYQIVLPINTVDDVFVDLDGGISLRTRLDEIGSDVQGFKGSVVDDFINVTTKLAVFLPKPIQLNHLYADDFSDATRFTVTSGVFRPGRIII